MVVTDKEYLLFVDNYFVTVDRLISIARKVIKRDKLSLREKSIFDGKTKEVNNIIIRLTELKKPAK